MIVNTQKSVSCEISYIPPFDWNAILAFLKLRSCPGAEFVDGDKYSRTAELNGYRGWITVSPSIENENALLVSTDEVLKPVLPDLVARLERFFDTRTDTSEIERLLGETARETSGMRLIGAYDGFEMAIRAILGQQVTVKAATTIFGRVASRFGTEIETPFPQLTHLTPTAHSLAKATMTDLTTCGITQVRANTLISLAQEVDAERIVLKPGVDPQSTMNELKKIKGIGEWTAQYIAMRALSFPDAFPHTDLGLRKALNVNGEKEIVRIAEKWRPWRAYAVMHLWTSLSKN